MRSEQDTNVALLAYKRAHTHHDMRNLLQSVAGVSAMSQVPPEKREAVIAACESGEVFDGVPPPVTPKRTWEGVTARAYEVWNRKKGEDHA